MTRIGPRMSAIVYYVKNNPGCSMLDAAKATRGHYNEGHKYGYAAAHRAWDADLIDVVRTKRGYKLYPAGEAPAESEVRSGLTTAVPHDQLPG